MNVMVSRPEEPPLSRGFALVPEGELAADYARIVAAHEAESAEERRRKRGQGATIWMLTGCLAAMAAAIAVMLPLKTTVPVYVSLREDGSFNTSINQRDLTTGERDAAIKATLWMYVRSRVSYSSGAHYEDQRLVYMMSDSPTSDTFQAEVAPKNPESPWRKWGTRTVIRLERLSEYFPCAYENCYGRTPDTYKVRFRRVVTTEGQPPRGQPYEATLRFRVVPNVPAMQRVTYNPLGLQVVEFNLSEEGAAQ